MTFDLRFEQTGDGHLLDDYALAFTLLEEKDVAHIVDDIGQPNEHSVLRLRSL